jgi:hypothetical protein
MQADPDSMLRIIRQIGAGTLDVIVDDGSHFHRHQVCVACAPSAARVPRTSFFLRTRVTACQGGVLLSARVVRVP